MAALTLDPENVLICATRAPSYRVIMQEGHYVRLMRVSDPNEAHMFLSPGDKSVNTHKYVYILKGFF